MKAAGYGFAIIRATQGTATSKPVGADTAFRQHIEGALAAGLQVGVYHAFIASVEGGPQAAFFHDAIAPYIDRLNFPPAIDVELDNGQSAEDITRRLLDMAKTLEALDLTPMIYTSPGFWNSHTVPSHDAYFAKLPLWVANWTTAPTPTLPRGWHEWFLWQYTSDGAVDGVEGRVDLNRLP